jgi:hypothetical protein
MNKRTLLIGLAALSVALLVAAVALAQTSTGFDLSWHVLAGGGGRVNSTHYAVNGTLGQGLVGFSGGTAYAMQSGYWQKWPDYRIYLPLTLKAYSG